MVVDERSYVNITEAAAILGVSRVTIWRWIRDGRLAASQLGHRTTRIRRGELDRLIARGHPAGENTGAATDGGRAAGAAIGMSGHPDASPPAVRWDNEAALRLRDEFLVIAAQEMETPFVVFSADAETVLQLLAEDAGIDPEHVVRTLRAVAGQAEKLARLIDLLLSASPRGVDRPPAARPAVGVGIHSDWMAPADATGGDPRFRGEGDAPVFPSRLRQVLGGLLDNAVKYGPDGGPIDVVVSLAAPEVVELSIPDRGAGLTPGQRVQNLERFYRDHGANRESGFGLGQFISRQIVSMHGGEIRAEFPADGGARFVVRLPVGAAERAVAGGRSAARDE